MGSEVVMAFGEELRGLGWITELWVAGSLATGDYFPKISDLDLVAVVDGPVGDDRRREMVALHQRVDAGVGAGFDLGCVYVDGSTIGDVDIRHATWTHGQLVDRILSGVTRAELVRHGYAVFGREPQEVLPAVSDEFVRAAARAELAGYWSWAARRPWIWLDPVMIDLGLTSMARGRHALRTGALLTKSAAIEKAAAPPWLINDLRARRRGETVSSPRLRSAFIAWKDAFKTTFPVRPTSSPPP